MTRYLITSVGAVYLYQTVEVKIGNRGGAGVDTALAEHGQLRIFQLLHELCRRRPRVFVKLLHIARKQNLLDIKKAVLPISSWSLSEVKADLADMRLLTQHRFSGSFLFDDGSVGDYLSASDDNRLEITQYGAEVET